jgi:isocitrate lyase
MVSELGARGALVVAGAILPALAIAFRRRVRAIDESVSVQERELALEEHGYTARRHQREVGAGYFDRVLETVSNGESSTLALRGSTEESQFRAAQTA